MKCVLFNDFSIGLTNSLKYRTFELIYSNIWTDNAFSLPRKDRMYASNFVMRGNNIDFSFYDFCMLRFSSRNKFDYNTE